jgi:hypothetical protein
MVNSLSLTSYFHTPNQIGCFSSGVAATALYYDSSSILGWGAASLLALASFGIQQVMKTQEKKIEQEQSDHHFHSQMYDWLAESMTHAQSPYSNEAKTEMLDLLNAIKENGFYIQEGNDDFRAKFVGFQNVFEHVVATQKTLKKIPIIFAAIVTPMPATPLCTPIDGRLVTSLMAPSISDDQDKRCTVNQRAVSIRRMLEQEGTNLFVVCQNGGANLRKGKEKEVFFQEVKKYENTLKFSELDCKNMDQEKVGAFYLLTDQSGNQYALWIQAQQANDPKDFSKWGIGFGRISDSVVYKRLREINDYVKDNNGPDVLEEFSKTCLNYIQRN